MKNRKLLILVPILLAVAAIISYLNIINVEKDSLKFKDEYEAINGKKSNSGNIYNDLTINKKNPIKYSNYEEVIDVINKGTGIIYLGYPECPWCRSAIPVLFEVANDYKINTIYYINMKNERDYYTIEDDKLVYALDKNGNEIKGTDGYFKLLEALKNELSDYIITLDDKTYEVGEKRIYVPTIIFVKDGKILGTHVSTVEGHTNGYSDMTKEQKQELYDIYEDYVIELSNSACSIGSSC